MHVIHKLMLSALGLGLFGGFGIGVLASEIKHSKQTQK
jgi:hypothetical protein